MQGEKGSQRKANGVLQVPAAQATNDKPHASKSSRSKAPEGDKVVIRRLPPGLTEEEFWEHLGTQWKSGAGLVVWAHFKSGKVSQDPAKSSKPGRAYLHVAKRDSLAELSDIVQTKSWEDAKLTNHNPCLVGPPVLEFSIYKRIPGTRKRSDQRQGTIDQDPEFMAFLQSLTNPEPDREAASSDEKLAAEDAEVEAKVTTTPLIEYLKEKKANKAKDAAAAKSAKQASKSKGGSAATAAEEPNKKSKKDKDKNEKDRERDREKDKEKDAKASKSPEKPKENVKILTKRAATTEAAKAAENAANQINAAQEAPKSRRANITAAARILQRDLGMSPGSAHRKARLNAAKSEAEAKTASSAPAEAATSPATEPVPAAAPSSTSAAAAASDQPAERPPTPTAAKSGRSRRGGGKGANANEGKGKAVESSGSKTTSSPAPAKPVVLLKKKDSDATSTVTPASQPEPQPEAAPPATKKNTSPSTATQHSASKGSSGKASASAKKSSAAVTPGATRAFVKHANPSQGITESALKQTFETFGAVTSVEVDRRKGFAYVDFSDHDALAKAVGASPVSVAQGAVQVMERKEKKGGGASTGGGSSNSKANNEAAAATAPGGGASSAAPPPAPEKPENTGSGSGRRNRRGRGGGGGGGGNKSNNAKGSAGESKPAASAV